MEFVRAAAYGVAYLAAFSAALGVVLRARGSRISLGLAIAFLASTIWAFATLDLVAVAVSLGLALITLLSLWRFPREVPASGVSRHAEDGGASATVTTRALLRDWDEDTVQEAEDHAPTPVTPRHARAEVAGPRRALP